MSTISMCDRCGSPTQPSDHFEIEITRNPRSLKWTREISTWTKKFDLCRGCFFWPPWWKRDLRPGRRLDRCEFDGCAEPAAGYVTIYLRSTRQHGSDGALAFCADDEAIVLRFRP